MTDDKLLTEILQLRAALTALAAEKEQLQQEKERYVVLWQEQRSVKEGWRESCLAAHRAMNSIEERAAQKLSAVSTRLAQVEQENKRLDQACVDWCVDHGALLVERAKEREASAILRAALEKYGRHLPSCPNWTTSYEHACTCGFKELALSAPTKAE